MNVNQCSFSRFLEAWQRGATSRRIVFFHFLIQSFILYLQAGFGVSAMFLVVNISEIGVLSDFR